MKTPKEKGLLVVFQRDLTQKDGIKLARRQSDMRFSEISPLSICVGVFSFQLRNAT